MKNVLILSLLLSACGADSQSSPQWGTLRGFNKQQTFLAKGQLLICGEAKLHTFAYSAIEQWEDARGNYRDPDVETSCATRKQYVGSVKLSFSSCPRYVMGFHTQEGNHHDISICKMAAQQYWQQILTHEIGHAYGLCDQYADTDAGKIVFNSNCWYPRSKLPQRSIMGGLYPGAPTELTRDDVEGIQTLDRR